MAKPESEHKTPAWRMFNKKGDIRATVDANLQPIGKVRRMSFYIKFISTKPAKWLDDPALLGEICIGSYRDTFMSKICCWSREDYKAQWKKALERIVEGKTTSALITDFHYKSNLIILRPMWRRGDMVYFQEKYLMMHTIKGKFNPDRPFIHIGRQATFTISGGRSRFTSEEIELLDKVDINELPVGQNSVNIKYIISFLNSLGKQRRALTRKSA